MRSLLVALLLPLVVACGDGGTGTVRVVAGDSNGQVLRTALSTRSASDFDAIRLNVVSLRVKVKSDHDGEDWHELLRVDDRPFVLELHRLLKGEAVELGRGEVPVGKLSELRFVLDSRDPGYAVPAGGDPARDRIAVRVPSGTTSGLKVKGKSIEILEGEVRKVVMDFDVQSSLKDEKDGLRIRPVIRLRGVDTVEVPNLD